MAMGGGVRKGYLGRSKLSGLRCVHRGSAKPSSTTLIEKLITITGVDPVEVLGANDSNLRIIRGILLKGSGLDVVALELWPIALFAVVALTVSVVRYRQTLD